MRTSQQDEMLSSQNGFIVVCVKYNVCCRTDADKTGRACDVHKGHCTDLHGKISFVLSSANELRVGAVNCLSWRTGWQASG